MELIALMTPVLREKALKMFSFPICSSKFSALILYRMKSTLSPFLQLVLGPSMGYKSILTN